MRFESQRNNGFSLTMLYCEMLCEMFALLFKHQGFIHEYELLKQECVH